MVCEIPYRDSVCYLVGMFIDGPQAFLALPFGVKETPSGPFDFDELFVEIQATLSDLAVTGTRLDPTFEVGSARQHAVEAMRRSDFVIADISGLVPSVMTEVGIALGLGKPLLLLSSSRSDDIPFDLRSYQVAIYRPGDLETVKKYIRLMVDDVLSRRETAKS